MHPLNCDPAFTPDLTVRNINSLPRFGHAQPLAFSATIDFTCLTCSRLVLNDTDFLPAEAVLICQCFDGLVCGVNGNRHIRIGNHVAGWMLVIVAESDDGFLVMAIQDVEIQIHESRCRELGC